jgi:MFS family permease
VAGPIVAGALIKADVFGSGWRALFFMNVPLGVFALVIGARVLPRANRQRGIRLDAVGTALVAAASVLIVYPLVDGRSHGWPLWIFAVMAAAVPVLGVFAAQQRRRTRRGRTALIELSVLRKRSYVSGVVFTLVFFGSIVGFSLTTGLFLQLGLGFSAMKAALYLTGMAVGACVGSGVGAWAATAVGRPILHVGLTIMAAGVTTLLVSVHLAGAAPGVWALVPGLGVFGVGMGMIFVPLFSIITGEIEDHEVGSASGLLEALQQLGASLGVAVLATLFFGRLGRGHVHAIEATWTVSLVLIGVAFALGWLLPKKPRAEF